MDTTRTRVKQLRQVMQCKDLDAYIVLSSNPHLSEYSPKRWRSRQWLSGFDGSSGTLVVTHNFIGMWVDSRYLEQAYRQLKKENIQIIESSSREIENCAKWITHNVNTGSRIGVDGEVLSVSCFRLLSSTLSSSSMILDTSTELLDKIWIDRPTLPSMPVYEHRLSFAGTPRQTKIRSVRAEMLALGAQLHWMSALDDIAWLFNLRGNDIEYSPVFLAHALIDMERATLFVDCAKIDRELHTILKKDNVDIIDYRQANQILMSLPTDKALLIDPKQVAYSMFRAIKNGTELIENTNPATVLKSRKTYFQISQFRSAMEQDGIALCEFFSSLEEKLNRRTVTELTVSEELTAARSRRKDFVSPSFPTIAAFNENSALPHYHATYKSYSVIRGDGLLLIDSGGQYLNGTTDITRVIAVGNPSSAQKHDFTLVLKSIIALSSAQFPRNIPAPMLDSIARSPIWKSGTDYKHSTGHGVGYFLDVHEKPQIISYHATPDPLTNMQPGMVHSIEPGIYRLKKWGVRIENLVVTQKCRGGISNDFLCFETLTLCPIDVRCIEISLLSPDELAWLNDYHQKLRARLVPFLDENTRTWLIRSTEKVNKNRKDK